MSGRASSTSMRSATTPLGSPTEALPDQLRHGRRRFRGPAGKIEPVSTGEYLQVAEVGRRTGLTRKALRLYETMGLLEPAERTEAGYRLYDAEALRRIELINRAKVLGLTLAETKEFLHVAEGCCG